MNLPNKPICAKVTYRNEVHRIYTWLPGKGGKLSSGGRAAKCTSRYEGVYQTNASIGALLCWRARMSRNAPCALHVFIIRQDGRGESPTLLQHLTLRPKYTSFPHLTWANHLTSSSHLTYFAHTTSSTHLTSSTAWHPLLTCHHLFTWNPLLTCHHLIGTPTKGLVSKRQVSKRLKRQVYKTSGLQNVRFTKRQVFKTSGCKKTSIYILYSPRILQCWHPSLMLHSPLC